MFRKRCAKFLKMRKMKKILTRMTKIKFLLIKSKNVDNKSLIISYYINCYNNSFLTINLVVVLRRIRKYQKNEKLLMSKASFRRLFKEIVRDIINENNNLCIQTLTINIL